MVRACHPTVNEFFFADHVLLVEGETEQAAFSNLFAADPDRFTGLHVVNCMGKANLPLFARILNQFGTPYTIVHDSDAPRAQRKGKWIANSMWTINAKIEAAIEERSEGLPACRMLAHIPDFEGHYFGTKLSRDKPYQVTKIMNSPEFGTAEEFAGLREMANGIIEGNHSSFYSSFGDLKARVKTWVDESNPQPPDDAWKLD